MTMVHKGSHWDSNCDLEVSWNSDPKVYLEWAVVGPEGAGEVLDLGRWSDG